MVSRSADTFVPFDTDSGITDEGPVECPVATVSRLPGVIRPSPIFTPDPSYPDGARQRRVSGEVTLAVDVLPDGSTDNIRVVNSLDPALDQSAVQTVTLWKFKPATRAGIPVKVEIRVNVSFRLFSTPMMSQSGPVYTDLPCAAKIDSRDIKGLLKKAYKGDPKAQFIIGCACEYGVARRSPDRPQAIEWYRKAAETLVPAQYFLGETYLSIFDFVNGYTWLRIADLNGYKDPNDRLKTAALILSKDQLRDAEEQVAAWKRQHGMN